MKKKAYIAPSIEVHIMEATDTILRESTFNTGDGKFPIIHDDPSNGIRLSKEDNWGNLWIDDFEDEEEY